MNNEERELRDLFLEQRAREAANAPTFADIVSRKRSNHRRFRLAGAPATAVAALILVVAAILALPRRLDHDETPSGGALDLTSRVWRAPTDFLLQVPGSELLRTVPTFGDSLPGMARNSRMP